ncbi:MAG: hypothetical protein H6842_11910 [Rhodospirillaceae bacterium]|nr:hypothetical protein [Rhodospirillaceae bacterium]
MNTLQRQCAVFRRDLVAFRAGEAHSISARHGDSDAILDDRNDFRRFRHPAFCAFAATMAGFDILLV